MLGACQPAGVWRSRNVTRALAAGRRAQARFAKRAGKALTKAEGDGAAYSRPDVEAIVTALDVLVRDVGNASAGVAP